MQRLRRTAWRYLALLAVLALVAGCGDDGEAVTTTAATITTAATTTSGVTPTSAETTTTVPPEPIRIGALFPLTGANAVLGTQTYQGAEIARQMINDMGGVNGRPIEFEPADAPDPDTAVSEATRLIADEGVNIIVGTQSSALSFPASAVAEREGVIYWEVCATADRITSRGFQYLFRYNTPGSMIGTQMADALVDYLAPLLGVAAKDLKIALVYEDSAYGATIGRAAALRATQRDIPLAVEESYTAASTTDFSSLLLRLKEAEIQVLIGVQLVDDTINFWNQATELQFNPQAVMMVGGVTNPAFLDAFGDRTTGFFTVDTPNSAALPETALSADAIEIRDEYRRRYVEAYGEDQMSTNSDLGFSGAWVLFHDALPLAGSDDPEAVRQAALSLDLPYGSTLLGYGIQFAPPSASNAGQNTRALSIVAQWQDQEIVAMWPEQFARGEAVNIPLPPWSE